MRGGSGVSHDANADSVKASFLVMVGLLFLFLFFLSVLVFVSYLD